MGLDALLVGSGGQFWIERGIVVSIGQDSVLLKLTYDTRHALPLPNRLIDSYHGESREVAYLCYLSSTGTQLCHLISWVIAVGSAGGC